MRDEVVVLPVSPLSVFDKESSSSLSGGGGVSLSILLAPGRACAWSALPCLIASA